MSRRQDTPDRTWSSDSHLLPAGIRHVPRRDIPPHVRSEEPPVRPWQEGEPPRPRPRPPQRVRFEGSYDEYEPFDALPPRRPHGSDYYRAGVTRQEAQRSEQEEAERAALELEEELRIEEEEFKRHLRKRRLDREAMTRERRKGSGDDHSTTFRRSARTRMQTQPPISYRRAASSLDDEEVQARRSRSSSPPERFIKAELYSDPETYDAEPATGTTSGNEPPPPPPKAEFVPPSPLFQYHAGGKPARSPGSSDNDDDDSDTSWDSRSDHSGDPYNFYNERKIYEFNPGRLSRSGSQGASTTLSGSIGDISTAVGSGDGEGGLRAVSPDPSLGPKLVLPYRIYQSEYTGDGFPDGSHSVRLTAILDSKRQRQPLFRWRHIQQTVMNFDELSKEVSRIGGLTDADNHGLQRLLSDVVKYSIKSIPTSNGSNVKHMEPGLLQVRIDADRVVKTKSIAARTAAWLCIPYFTLQKYAGPLAGAAPGSFPTRTLLQEQYSGVSAERDMQQAVCQTGHAPAGMCFHVAQLWCIVLDDSLLITCGTMSDPTKKGDFDERVELITKPSQDPSISVSSFIYVYYTEAVMYALPTDQCRSWFAFISHFHEFWPRTLKFTFRDSLVKPSDWPSIFNTARLSNTKVLLVLTLGAAPQPPPRGVLKSNVKAEDDVDKNPAAEATVREGTSLKPLDKGKQNATGTASVTSEWQDDNFNVFAWFRSSAASREASGQGHAEFARAQLQDMDDFLQNEVNRPDRRAYQACPQATRLECLAYLEQHPVPASGNARLRRGFEDRVDVYNAAEMILRFFLPLDATGPTIGKFWGAVRRIVEMPKPDTGRQYDSYHGSYRPGSRSVSSDYLVYTRSALRDLTQDIQSFTNIILHAQPLERANIKVPVQLLRAWIYILLALAKATKKTMARNAHFDIARDLLREGMAEVMMALPSEDLLSREVVLPMEIVSLLSLKLLRDTTGAYPNIDAVYSECFDALDNEVATKPSERSFEHRINLLKQEATIINRIVTKQRRIFAALTPADGMQEPFIITTLTPTGPAPKKRALDEGGDYYQSYGSASKDPNNRDIYIERERDQARLMSVEAQRSRSRAPSVHEGYSPHHLRYDDTSPPLLPYDGVAPPAREYYRLSATQPGGLRDLLTTDCLSLIDRRNTTFSELFPYANYLQEYNKNKYDTTRDRQEQALYAFTIVTVIFLPLSAVAGIFGMNTSDIRDMTSRQWLYWATAVPVTVAVILIGLWWMGELGNVAGWLIPGIGRRNPYAGRGWGGGGTSSSGSSWRVGKGGSQRSTMRVMDDRVLVPVMMQQDDGGDLDADDDEQVTVRRAPVPMVMRRRSVGPGYATDEYPPLEAGGPAGYQRGSPNYARYR